MQPKFYDRSGNFYKFPEGVGLSQKAGCPELIRGTAVLKKGGGGEDDDGNLAELLVVPDLLEGLQSQHTGHIQVQQDQGRKFRILGIQGMQQRLSRSEEHTSE